MTILQIPMMGAKFVVGFLNIHLWYLEESALKFAYFFSKPFNYPETCCE
jgi:hypothetical protein